MSETGVRGIDLFKIAGESISGWIPRRKIARATSEMSPNFRPILFGLKVRTSEDCTKDWRFRYMSLAHVLLMAQIGL